MQKKAEEGGTIVCYRDVDKVQYQEHDFDVCGARHKFYGARTTRIQKLNGILK